jgi:diguanylate cyclase (GGDEF)-like protein
VLSTQSLLDRLARETAHLCRGPRSDSELLLEWQRTVGRCAGEDRFWLRHTRPDGRHHDVGATTVTDGAVELGPLVRGQLTVDLWASPEAAPALLPALEALGHNLAVLLEVRAVLGNREAELESASFQLRALRRSSRLIASAVNTEETERLALDLVGEALFSWWSCLYRPEGDEYIPRSLRSLVEGPAPGAVNRAALDAALPEGSPPVGRDVVRVAALVDPRAWMVVPLDPAGDRVGLIVLGPSIHERDYGRADYELAGALAAGAGLAIRNAELMQQLRQAAATDPLTGLPNRRTLETRLEAEIQQSARRGLDTSVALLDLDGFKTVNDTLGHSAGDRLLCAVADTLRRLCRRSDVAGRLGGDEFMVIMPLTSPAEAAKFAERLHEAMARFTREVPEFGATGVSVGIAHTLSPSATVDRILSAADAALYQVKRHGTGGFAVARDQGDDSGTNQ